MPQSTKLDLSVLKKNLISSALLKKIIYLEEVSSTNSYAREINAEGDTMIITDNQSSGKGRFDRVWTSAAGKDLTFTLVFDVKIDISEMQLINFYSSLTLFETLRDLFRDNTEINFALKWPNDILLNEKKVAGILFEVINNNPLNRFLIGIGINVNSHIQIPELKNIATSLFMISGSETSRDELLMQFLKHFYSSLHRLDDKKLLLKNWLECSDVKGREVKIRMSNAGLTQTAKILDIECDGMLHVKFDDGEERIVNPGIIL